jgi:hypothetical protein
LNIQARHSFSARRNLLVLVSLLATEIAFGQSGSPTLRSAYQNHFLIGAALNTSQVNGRIPKASKIAARQFSSVTAENDMKWERIHPEPGRYDFKKADAYVEFARSNRMALIEHTLVWHSQIPDWVFKGKDGGYATKWSAKWIAAQDTPMNPPKGATYLPAVNPPGRFTSAEANPLGYHAVIASNADTMNWVQVDLGAAKPLESVRLRAPDHEGV